MRGLASPAFASILRDQRIMDRETKTQPRLILFTPDIGTADNFTSLLTAVCAAIDVAAVIMRTGTAADSQIVASAQNILPVAQQSGAALLLEGHPKLVAGVGADGAHISGIEAFQSAVSLLKPQRIAGVGALTTRHDAMTAGEAGADFVMFGEPDAAGRRPAFDTIVDRVAWWAEIFQVPCVGYAANINEVEKFARAGADFIAVGDALWNATEEPMAIVRQVAGQLQAERTA
jgi:thiamine-phosphate pyrophosphorylase